jgi:general secretion pathway protein A
VALTTNAFGQLYSFFGLREDPFHISPNSRFYFSTRLQDSAFAELTLGIQTRQGLMVLTGEAGTGKTTLLNQILKWLEANQRSSAYVFYTALEAQELLEFILRDFGIEFASSRKGDLVATLHQWLLARNAEGDSPVVILDEAQALSLATMNELRLLLNLENENGKLLQVILSGQPELEENLRHPDLHQLSQRVTVHCRLSALKLVEIPRYISSRLSVAGSPDDGLFPLETIRAIHQCSRGIPRVINLICKEALLGAYANHQHVIAPEIIYSIASDLNLSVSPFVPHEGVVPVSVAAVPHVDSAKEHDSALAESQPQHVAVPRPEVRDSRNSANVSVHATEQRAPVARLSEPARQTPSINHPKVPRELRNSQSKAVRDPMSVTSFISRYFVEVADSLNHDFRVHVQALFLSSKSSVHAPSTSDAPNAPSHKSILARLAGWLREPVPPPGVRRVSSPVRQPSSKIL